MRERLPKTSPDSSLYEMNDSLHFLNYATALSPRFVFVLWKYVFSFHLVLFLTMAKTCASLNSCCGTCSLVCFCSDEVRRFPFVFPTVYHGEIVCTWNVTVTLLLSRKAQVCTLRTPGVLLFAAF